jgi:hypothetical protein
MIHVLDALSVPPGNLREVRARVRDVYRPLATSMGMTLQHTWIAPAVELLDRPTELLLLWALDDTAAYWKARSIGSRDPQVIAFWRELAPLLGSRTRRIMVDPDDGSVLR